MLVACARPNFTSFQQAPAEALKERALQLVFHRIWIDDPATNCSDGCFCARGPYRCRDSLPRPPRRRPFCPGAPWQTPRPLTTRALASVFCGYGRGCHSACFASVFSVAIESASFKWRKRNSTGVGIRRKSPQELIDEGFHGKVSLITRQDLAACTPETAPRCNGQCCGHSQRNRDGLPALPRGGHAPDSCRSAATPENSPASPVEWLGDQPSKENAQSLCRQHPSPPACQSMPADSSGSPNMFLFPRPLHAYGLAHRLR